jgi:hypothetical protein
MSTDRVADEQTVPRTRPEARTSPLTAAQRALLGGAFLLLVSVYAATAGGHAYSVDEEITFQTTRSLVHLDPEVEVVDPNFPQLYHRGPDGGFVGIYGLGQPIAQIPLYVVGSAVARAVPSAGRDVLVHTTTSLTNSVITAMTAVVVVLVARSWTTFDRALGLGAVFALGTYAWPHAKTSFAEPGTALCVLLAVAGAIAWYRGGGPRTLVGAGAAAVCAVVFRVSAVIFLPVLVAFVAPVAWRRGGARALGVAAGWFLAGGLVPGAFLLATNAWRFDGPFDTGYPTFSQDFPVVRGVAYQLISPGKSVFLYAPVLVVAVVGAGVAQRRAPGRGWERGLMATVVVANLVFFGRVAFWAGDNAWGPRYVQIVLPLAVLLVAPLLDDARWWRGVKVAGVVGAAVPALLGVLLYFNVLYVEASAQLGDAPVSAKGDRPRSTVALSHEWAWQPFRRTVGLLPEAVADVAGHGDPRPPYSSDPATHYGFYATEPRLDFWWLWVEPAHGSRATYLLWLPIAATAVAGVALVRAGRAGGGVGSPARGPIGAAGSTSWDQSARPSEVEST